ncbi:MAG: tetratricopeptide repeat protein [Anaerolineae bacterium]|nr:tetratricopeptide repeat protein [Anaerolineae bacterium]
MLRIELLGGMHITQDDEPVTGFISSKAQALLCYLVMHPQQYLLRSSLAAMFWGDMPDEDAATNLRQVIANLKKLFERYFDISRQSIAFMPTDSYWLDVAEFETGRDIRLYHGDLLAGFAVSDAPVFEEWLTVQQARIHDMAVTTLRQLADACAADADDQGAVAALRRLITLDPLQEDAHRALMLALALSGQRAAALLQYEQCREVLDRELSVEPEPETEFLYRRIKHIERILIAPSETTPFVGREHELAELIRRLREPTCRLITIVGLGGVGKTRLVTRFVHLAAPRMLHGAAMIDLTAVSTPDGMLKALAEGLHLPLTRESNPRQQVLRFLRERHMLLVLDNFEQLVRDGIDLIGDIIERAPEVKIVITSRERLNLRDEWVLALHGLRVGAADDPTPAPAQALFWETVRRIRGDDKVEARSVAVERICEMVEGMPLAIELAASWTRLLTAEEIAEEIASNLILLESSSRDDDSRHQSLRAVFEHSWGLFSPDEQKALLALSAFGAGFTRAAAEQVAGASLSLLLSFSDKMLLRRDGSGRYWLHEVTRQYLAERFALSSSMAQVQQKFIYYFAVFLQAREAALKARDQGETIHEIGVELENLHRAWRYAAASDSVESLSMMMPALSLYHDMTAAWQPGEALFQAASAVIHRADPAVYGAWCSHLALLCSRQDRLEEADQYARRALEVLSEDEPAHFDALARAFMVLGNLLDTRGVHAESPQYFLRALDLRLRIGDDWGGANCYLSLAGAYGRAGDDESAQRYAEVGLTISEQIGDLWLTTRLQMVLAIVAANQGDIDRAEAMHHSNLEIFEQLGSEEGKALALSGLGAAASFRGAADEARNYYLKAVDFFHRAGSELYESNTWFNLGEISMEAGDLVLALEYFEQSLVGFRRLGYEYGIGEAEARIQAIQAGSADG